ncbi:MAG TPA: M14 family metallopeptidase [Balneolaceae bacterium]|nr:M14 family metallopeptidase [Balneolaceae bacterium]
MFGQNFQTVFEQSDSTRTATYQEGMKWWQRFSDQYPTVQMRTMGLTDSGEHLHLITVSSDETFDYQDLRKQDKCVILINNDIHPGEPDGVEATMMLVRDLVQHKDGMQLPENVVLAVIPFYNIGGALNRNSHTRANQNGPEAYGFRGNARNLDLDRDFTKADSYNALSFAKIFHLVDPDIMIDNHVSDGADYQHIMTLLVTQHNKLGGELGDYLHDRMVPGVYKNMKEKGYDLVPYVNDFSATPEKGWNEFYDSPRYSSGYAALFGTFSFMPEAHMLKPFKLRVPADYAVMQSFIEFAHENGDKIHALRQQFKQQIQTKQEFPLHWKIDSTRHDMITFKGYQSGHKPSEISGLARLYYDEDKPFTRKVPFYDYFKARKQVQKPDAYIIPQGWHRVIRRLQTNAVKMSRLPKDTTMAVQTYHVANYKSLNRPYELHHVNYDVQVTAEKDSISFRKGDYFIPMDQPANRYLVNVLEPEAKDSFFAWNFFDTILQRKEYFSDYVFEDLAAKYLKGHPALRDSLEKKREADSTFANSASAQLQYVYTHSPWSEPEYLRYPVYRYFK